MFSLFIIICLFQSLFCGLCNNKKVEINKDYVNSILTNFYPEIKQILNPMRKFNKPKFSISNFSLDKIQVSIKKDRIVNLMIKDVKPFVYWRNFKNIGCFNFNNYCNIDFSNFKMEMNIKFNGNYTSDCQYSPNAELVGNPKIIFNVIKDGNCFIMEKKYNIRNYDRFLLDWIMKVFWEIKSTVIKNYNKKMKNQ